MVPLFMQRLVGDLRRRRPGAQGAVRPPLIVPLLPGHDSRLRLPQLVEDLAAFASTSSLVRKTPFLLGQSRGIHTASSPARGRFGHVLAPKIAFLCPIACAQISRID